MFRTWKRDWFPSLKHDLQLAIGNWNQSRKLRTDHVESRNIRILGVFHCHVVINVVMFGNRMTVKVYILQVMPGTIPSK